MISTTLSPAAETFVSIVNTFGCLSKAQTQLLFSYKDQSSRLPSAMINLRLIKERESMYVPKVNPVPDKTMIDCLWVAIGKIKRKDGTYDTDALKLAYSNKPVQIAMLSNDMFYNIVGINSDNLFSTLAFLTDRYNKAKKHDDGVEYIFVIRNEDLIDEILDNEPPMPYRIVLLDGDGPEGPRLRYLKK